MSLALVAYPILLLLSTLHLPGCHGYNPPSVPVLTRGPGGLVRIPRRNETEAGKRAITSQLSTCGYHDGDPERSRTANSGFNCRVDTQNGLWGFCPTTVISAIDCGLAGCCEDKHSCSDGCGYTGRSDLTTFTCESDSFCSTALLTFGVDQAYAYIGCGPKPTTNHYLISPTAQKIVSTTSSSESESSSSSTTSSASKTTPSETRPTTRPQETSSASSPAAAANGDPVSESTGSSSSSSSSSSSPNTGAIIGGVIGGLALICVSAIAAIYLLRKNQNRQKQRQSMAERHAAYPPPGSGPQQPWTDEEQHKAQLVAAGGWRPGELPAYEAVHNGRGPVEMAG